MDTIDSLRADLRYYRNLLQNKQNEKQGYLDVANEIAAVYQRLADDKKTIKGYRDSVKTFVKEKYDSFTGHQFSKEYKPEAQTIVDSYNTLIKNIDSNMDKLNLLRASYENKANMCNGLIGYFQSMVNTLEHSIQNLFN